MMMLQSNHLTAMTNIFLEKIYSDICCSDADCEDNLYYATFESSFLCNSFVTL